MDTLKVGEDVDGYKQELGSQDMTKNAGLEWKITYEKKNILGFRELTTPEALT